MDAELESRLEELFGREDAPPSPQEARAGGKGLPGPLDDLKSAVLSIDWEITDEGLAQFISQVKKVEASSRDDNIAMMFLQLLGALGDYIRSNRGRAHPKTFKILTSVFSGLEKVVSRPELSELEKKTILRLELKKYNDLRTLIQKKKTRPQPEVSTGVSNASTGAIGATPQSRAAAATARPPEEPLTAKALARAVEELKAFVHNEIEALRSELKR